jgi:serine/threonine protein phosphatase PrpC
MTSTFRLYAGGATHPGLQRSRNEDYFSLDADLGLLVVADGVGGRVAGDVAAKLAVDTVHDALAETTWPDDACTDPDEMGKRLLDAFTLAHRRVREHGQRHPRLEGMATTLVAAMALAGRLWIGHAGDSRAYLFRAGQLTRLTTDHSVAEDAVLRARLKPEVLAQLDPANLTRAAGLGETLSADIRFEELRAGDTVLLCTDGVTSVLDETEIASILDEYHDPGAAASTLIDRANLGGGPDNSTAIVARWAP